MIRELAKRLQFASNTTVDGNRLDAFMQGINDRFNGLLPRDIERRWAETLFVSGWQPALVASGQGPTPFLPVQNTLAQCTDDPPNYPTNPWRVKGTEVSGIEPDKGAGTNGYQWAWTQSFYFYRPVILSRLSWALRTDGVNFDNGFQFGATPPPGKTNGQYVDDFCVEISVDNPYSTENRAQGTSEVQVTNFSMQGALLSHLGVPAGVTDLEPNYDAGGGASPAGGVLYNQALDIPIPHNSRVRVSLVMPQYNIGTYDADWGEDPWHKHIYSTTLGVLEPTL